MDCSMSAFAVHCHQSRAACLLYAEKRGLAEICTFQEASAWHPERIRLAALAMDSICPRTTVDRVPGRGSRLSRLALGVCMHACSAGL